MMIGDSEIEEDFMGAIKRKAFWIKEEQNDTDDDED